MNTRKVLVIAGFVSILFLTREIVQPKPQLDWFSQSQELVSKTMDLAIPIGLGVFSLSCFWAALRSDRSERVAPQRPAPERRTVDVAHRTEEDESDEERSSDEEADDPVVSLPVVDTSDEEEESSDDGDDSDTNLDALAAGGTFGRNELDEGGN